MDEVYKVFEPVHVEVLCTDVGEVVFCRDVMDGDPPLCYQFSDEEEQYDVLGPRRFPNACRVAVLLQYGGKCANSFPNPSSVSIFEQNTASFIARADATSSAFMVDITFRPCSPDLKLIGAFASIVT